MELIMEETTSDADWEHAFPFIAWREPLLVKTTDGRKGYGCRYCILRSGLNAGSIAQLPQTQEAFLEHLQEKHPRKK